MICAMVLALAALGAATAGRARADTGACTIYWTGQVNSDWGDAGNWSATDGGASSGQVPGATDVVCMSSTPATDTIDLGTGESYAIDAIVWPSAGPVSPQLQIEGSLQVGSGAADDPSTVNDIDLSGTLSLDTEEDLTAASLQLSGTLLGPGEATVTGPSTIAAGAVLGTDGASGSGPGLTLRGATEIDLGVFDLDGGSTLTNAGVITLDDGADVVDGDGAGNTVVNASGATIAYDGSQAATVAVALNNDGDVTARAGTLKLGPGDDTGTLTAETGATVEIDQRRTEENGSVIAGAGTTLIAPSQIPDPPASPQGGAITFKDGSQVTSSAGLDVQGIVDADGSAPLALSALTLDGGFLDGPGTIKVTGVADLKSGALGFINLSGGQESGDQGVHLVLEDGATVDGQVVVRVGGKLENEGTTSLGAGADLDAGDGFLFGGSIVNDASGTILGDSPDTTQPAGLDGPLANLGDIEVVEGQLRVDGVTNSGMIEALGGEVDLSDLSNSSTIVARGGTVDVQSLASGSTTLSGGSYVATSGTLALGPFTANAAEIDIGTDATFTSSTLTVNSGTLSISSPYVRMDVGSLTGSLTNSGTITVHDGGVLGVASFAQTGGTTTVESGGFLAANTIAIKGGELTGTGLLYGAVSGAGTIEPSGSVSGPLAIGDGTDGELDSYNGTGGTLTIAISGATDPGTDYGQLEVNGPATVGGTLDIQTAAGYLPPIGTKFTIVAATSLKGTFASIDGATLADRRYVPSYSGTAVTLTVEPPAAAPAITSVNPSQGLTAGGNVVTITGTDLAGATAVDFGSEPATRFTAVSNTKLTATVPADDAGPVDVTVTTPLGTSSTTPADQYTYRVPTPPTVTAVSPAAGPTTGGAVVTITGTNFTSTATVRFGTRQASHVSYVSPTELDATAPSRYPSTVDVTVVTADGTSVTSAVDHYTYAPAPAVRRVRPAAGPDAGGTTVTITGSQFTADSTVAFGSTPASTTTYLSSTEIQAVSPARSSNGPVDIRVTTPGGETPVVAGDVFIYGSPTVTAFTPTSGITGSRVTITGAGFTTDATVRFGTLASPTVTFRSASTLVAVVPNGAMLGAITVSESAGSTTSTNAFTPTLSITGLSPQSGAPGTAVEIDGVGFVTGSVVRFSGTRAKATFVSPTELLAIVPSTASSGALTVTNFAVPAGRVTAPVSFNVS